MKILIKSAIIIDSQSKYHLKKMDILIENGNHSKILKNQSKLITKNNSIKIYKLKTFMFLQVGSTFM